MQQSFSSGGYVFANIRGHSPWPAVVIYTEQKQKSSILKEQFLVQRNWHLQKVKSFITFIS